MNCGTNGKMKYIEELKPGDLFHSQKHKFIITSDYKFADKQTKKYFCISLENGNGRWFLGSEMIDTIELYMRDEDGNIQPIKDYQDPYNNLSAG